MEEDEKKRKRKEEERGISVSRILNFIGYRSGRFGERRKQTAGRSDRE